MSTEFPRTLCRASVLAVLSMALSACSSLFDYQAYSPPPRLTLPPPSEVTVEPLTLKNRLAEASLQGGNFTTAVELYRSRIQDNPDDFEGHMALGNALLEARALDEALRVFNDALALRPWSGDPLAGMGRASLILGRPEQAGKYYKEALAREPQHYEANNGLAVTRDYLGQHEEAQALYTSLLRRRPDDLRVKSNMGLSMALAGNAREGVRYLLSFAASPTAPTQARDNLAIAYALAGNIRAAREVMGLSLSGGQIDENLRFLALVAGVSRCHQGRAVCGSVLDQARGGTW